MNGTPRVRLLDDAGRLLLRDGVILCFFVRRSHQILAASAVEVLSAYRDFIRPHALTRYIDPEGAPAELTGPALDRLIGELTDVGNWPHYNLMLGDSSTGVSDFWFHYFGAGLRTPVFADWPDAASHLALWFPTEFLDEVAPHWLKGSALRMAEILPPCYGYASLSWNYCGGADEAEAFDEIRRRCFNHPGLDVHHVDSCGTDIGDRIRGVYWLNLLGEESLRELGPIDALDRRLEDAGADVEPLPGGGLAVSLGPRPEAGNLDAGQTLPIYRRVAQILKDRFHVGRCPFPQFTSEDTRRWVMRFVHE